MRRWKRSSSSWPKECQREPRGLYNACASSTRPSWTEKSKAKPFIQEALERSTSRVRPQYLEFDPAKGVGKMTRGARMSHAWVMWQHEGQWWILDCTMLSRPFFPHAPVS